MMQQYKKCLLSPSYMMNQYAIIQHPDLGAIKFDLWDFQQKLVDDFQKHNWNIILKSRQIGISTLVAGYVLWFCNFQPDKSVLIIANKQSVAMNLIKKIRLMYDGLPSWMRQKLTTDNKQSLVFQNRSFVSSAAATPDAGVSQALSLLVVDQAAVVRNNLMQQIWSSASPTLACLHHDTKVTIRNIKTRQIEEIQIGKLYNTTDIQDYQILTPSGFVQFKGVKKFMSNEYLTLTFKDGDVIKCTTNHVFFDNEDKHIIAKDIKENDVLYDDKQVLKVEHIIGEEQYQFYDILNVDNQDKGYLIENGIKSHNSAGSRCIMLSTPRGVGSLFHRLWTQAQQGKNRFHTTKLYWWVHPWRDQEWRDNQTKTMGQKKARRQYDCDFQSSGDTVLTGDLLKQIQQKYIKDPIQKMYSQMFWIWKYSQVENDYIISADVARGDGADYSSFQVLCIQDNQQVAQFDGQVGTRQYANFIVRVAKMYNNAFVIVQNASIGWAVLQQIVNLGYKNLYYHKKDFKYIDPDLHARQRQTKRNQRQKDILGFTTSSRTRPLIIQKMILVLQSNQFIIHSKRLLNQLWTFAWINGKPQAMDGYNDDLVMAFAIGAWVRYTSYVVKIEGQRLAKQRLAGISSGLNNKRQKQKKQDTGFFSGANVHSNMYKPNMVQIGGQQMNLYDMFGVKTK